MTGSIIKRPVDIYQFVSRYANCRQENFLVLTLSGRHEVIKVHHISKGTVERTLVHPRECFYPAIRDNAAAIIFAHNHPSGHVDFSDEDMGLSQRLNMAAKILGFRVVDHIVFAKNNKLLSLREHGGFKEDFEVPELERYVAGLSSNKVVYN